MKSLLSLLAFVCLLSASAQAAPGWHAGTVQLNAEESAQFLKNYKAYVHPDGTLLIRSLVCSCPSDLIYTCTYFPEGEGWTQEQWMPWNSYWQKNILKKYTQYLTSYNGTRFDGYSYEANQLECHGGSCALTSKYIYNQ